VDEEWLDHYAESLVTDLRDIDALEVDEWRLERIDE